MELAWKGYVITLRVPVCVERKQAESARDAAVKDISGCSSVQRRREEIEKEYILASGNRYVGPAR